MPISALEADLAACEDARLNEKIEPRAALKLIQTAPSSPPGAWIRCQNSAAISYPVRNQRNPPETKGPHERGSEPAGITAYKCSADAARHFTRNQRQLIAHARTELGRVISGQTQAIEEVLIAVLCQGHALLEGVPGIAKTLIVKALGTPARPRLSARAGHARPDARRHSRHHDSASRHGHLHLSRRARVHRPAAGGRDQPHASAHPGRAARVHGRAPGDERRHPPAAARWFTVFATQNPVDFEGTYPLPEAQLDRFLMKIRVAYPSEAEELQILERHHAGTGAGLLDDAAIAPIPAGMLAAARAEVRAIRIEPELYGYILTLARRTREWPTLLLGASPRAALSMMRVAQAAAAFDGRDYLVPDDVKRAIPPVLRHRVMLKPEAELEGFDADRVLADVIAAVPVPRQ